MKNIVQRFQDIRGFSYLEVLIALAVMGVVTTAIFKTYITQHKNYLIQDDITSIQQGVRASIDEMARNIRMAGYDIPDGVDAITASNTNPDTITLVYRTNNCDTYLLNAMTQTSSTLECATDVSCFNNGEWAYIFEPDSGGGEWFEISLVQAASNSIQHSTMPLSRSYGKDAIVLSMKKVKFFVNHTSDPEHPNLMVQYGERNPQLYAENISDLQFQYRTKNNHVIEKPLISDNIREVLITVTGRSNTPDPDNVEEPYRTRTYATSVNVRNLIN